MRFFLFALLLAGPAAAQVTELYRTVNPDGTVVFSDLPVASESERISIGVRPPAQPVPLPQEPTEPPAEEPAPMDDSQIAAQIVENCRIARESLASAMLSDRLYRILPNGELQFLTEEEVLTARETAQAQVDEWCNDNEDG